MGVTVCHMPRRQTGGYDLKPTAQEIIDRVSERRGMKKAVLVQRVMEFFARQPEPVQTAMLDAVDAGFEHQYATALEALADDYRRRAEEHHDKAVGITPPQTESGPANGSRANDPPPARRPGTRPTSARAK
jgi:hypothetical protein